MPTLGPIIKKMAFYVFFLMKNRYGNQSFQTQKHVRLHLAWHVIVISLTS